MKSQTKREYLRDLVAEKNRWHHPLPDDEKALGFLGWHERGYLPHCDFPGLVQFVTFRLTDSMPVSNRGEWEHLLKIEDDREKRMKLEEYLDRGIGECHLRDPRIAKLAEESLLFLHNQFYELRSWCVMPNHVHVLVHIWRTPLWKMVAMWKKFVAAKALAMLRQERRSPDRPARAGDNTVPNRSSALQSFWQREYWDTFMRDEAQEKTAIRYIENNPVKAKLCDAKEQWPFNSTKFRDKFQQLVVPTGAPISKLAR